jgi:hypothetical protein
VSTWHPDYVSGEHRNQWEQSPRDCVSTGITISLRCNECVPRECKNQWELVGVHKGGR